jgi:dihydroorotase
MPNTLPNTTTNNLIYQKNKIAEEKSLANYSFYIGATNDNIDEILKINRNEVCGIKLFMGSSTGNMHVEDKNTLIKLFSETNHLIAVHSEDENIIKNNLIKYNKIYGDNIPFEKHPEIRSREACIKSTSLAIELAIKYNTRLHISHISTIEEVNLLHDNSIKNITSEVCIPHLWFSDEDYLKYGSYIKCNPSIKTIKDKKGLMEAILEDKIDIIATDHAPHTKKEKQNNYHNAPSGIPSIQFSLLIMLEFYHNGLITLSKIVEKMCHAPAEHFKINKRGYIRKGYKADITIINTKQKWEVTENEILSKCKWSPYINTVLKSKVIHTFVNGKHVYNNGKINNSSKGEMLKFNY